jgi:hypothetical protein
MGDARFLNSPQRQQGEADYRVARLERKLLGIPNPCFDEDFFFVEWNRESNPHNPIQSKLIWIKLKSEIAF